MNSTIFKQFPGMIRRQNLVIYPVSTTCTTSTFTSSSVTKPKHLLHTITRTKLNLINSKTFSTITRGQDLLADSLNHGTKRKIILDSYYPGVGFDVIGMVEHIDVTEDSPNLTTIESKNAHIPIPGMEINQRDYRSSDGGDDQPHTLLMNSSVIAFPNSCFLWNSVSKPKDVTLESLSIIRLLKPSIEFLFIGCDEPLPPRELNKIKKALKEKSDIVVEQMDVMNAMGTFNILNGEDRRIAVALVVDMKSESSI